MMTPTTRPGRDRQLAVGPDEPRNQRAVRILKIAEMHDLLTYVGVDNPEDPPKEHRYTVIVRDREATLHRDEVFPYIWGLWDAAGLDRALIAYREGM